MASVWHSVSVDKWFFVLFIMNQQVKQMW